VSVMVAGKKEAFVTGLDLFLNTTQNGLC